MTANGVVHQQKKSENDNSLGKMNGNLVQNKLPEKKFEVRNSLLTDLFENPHIKTIHHIFAAALFGYFLNSTVIDYLQGRPLKLGLNLTSKGMAKMHWVLAMWLGHIALYCLAYFCLCIWARVRINLPPKSTNISTWDRIWLIICASYYVFAFRSTALLVTRLELPLGSAAVITLEQIRIVMKAHALIRSCVPRVRSFKPHSDDELQIPKFSHCLYFLFAPTLVYRDEYPRTKSINWNFVFWRVIDISGLIFYIAFVFERYFDTVQKDIGLRKYRWTEVAALILQNTLIGAYLLLTGFYILLHSWQNLFAELLRFGDRLFYRDWWTCTQYADFFRSWNVLVHDWLYTYVYKDCYELMLPGNKTVAKVLVFLISAVVHEWVMTCILGFFFPIMFALFFFAGTVLIDVRVPRSAIMSILFWYNLALGLGILVAVYTLEHYARLNVPVQKPTLKDNLIPRLFTCDCFA